MSAFTPREVARDTFAVARSMGRGRVMGADPAETAANRRQVWQRALQVIDRAQGTPRTFAQEPDDLQLEQMRVGAQAEVDRIISAEADRRDAQRARLERELVEPTTMLVGPRQWLGPDGTFR